MGGSVGGTPIGVEVFVPLSRIDQTSARISAGAPISTNLPSQAPIDSPDNLPERHLWWSVVAVIDN